MNTEWIKITLILFCTALLLNCEGKRKSIDTSGNITPKIEKKITVYGSVNCDHCVEFRNMMDSVKMKYEFKDAEAHEKYYTEMVLKVQASSYNGSILFPVLEVGDKILVRPEFVDFMKAVNQ